MEQDTYKKTHVFYNGDDKFDLTPALLSGGDEVE